MSDLLAIYLNDHLAGSTVGVELARRARGSNDGTELGEFLATLAAEIEEDRDTLGEVMGSVGAGRTAAACGLTYTPDPRRATARPSRCSSARAWRTVIRATL